jgi:hypothetical protein
MGWAATFFLLTTVALWYLGRYDRFGYLKLEDDWKPFKTKKDS